MYKGYSFYRALKYEPCITGYGFDSFEGLPSNTEGGKFYEGAYSCSLEQVEKDLNARGIHNYVLTKGFYKDTLTSERAEKLPAARIVLIDCDLYSSTKCVLDFITPKLQNGTYLLFDDWNCFNADDGQGERRACREWLDKNQNIKLHKEYDFGWHGIAFRVEMNA